MSVTPAPDLILYLGQFTTLDRSDPVATAVAVTDGKFSADGRDEDVMPLAGAKTKVVDLKGRIQIGQLADLIVPDPDCLACPAEEIADVTSELTVVGGRVVYGARDQPKNYGVASRVWSVGKRWMPLGAMGTILDPKGKATV